MNNEIKVSPISGSNVLYVRCFEILITATDVGIEFGVYYKGLRVVSYDNIKDAVEFCRE